MKVTNIWTGNWENALRGMRHPMESYAKSDSYMDTSVEWGSSNFYNVEQNFKIGPNDIDLAQRLIKAGSPHDKFLRQIFVSMDITAPLYFWKEMDQYRVGCTTNSTSTMHKLATTPITINCFEIDDYDKEWFDSTGTEASCDTWIKDNIIYFLESLRQKYLETKDIRYWKELIRWLPESWLQTRTWTADYSVVRSIIKQRENHKLSEWKTFIDYCKTLPYSQQFLFI
jgi:hypothetical protein